MVQNVNLIREINLSPPAILDSRLIAKWWGIGIFGLGLLYGILVAYCHWEHQQLVYWQETSQTVVSQVEAYRQQKQLWMARIGAESGDNRGEGNARSARRTGFSGYLQELAQFMPSGVWLTDIVVSQTKGIALKGHAIIAAGMMELVDVLSKSAKLWKKEFDEIRFKRDQKSHLIDFVIATDKTVGGAL